MQPDNSSALLPLRYDLLRHKDQVTEWPRCTWSGPFEYAPDGKPLYEIVYELASDNEVFAEKFLEGWQMMTQNGNEGLVDGPHHGWLGYHSLAEQGFKINNFKEIH